MVQHPIDASALIQAPAAKIYGIIADYRNTHPLILPKPYFISLDVEKGGTGAGTVINFTMRLMGPAQSFRATISEPEPGRRLVETTDQGPVTSYRVEPEGGATRVTIHTDMPVPDGAAGKFQGWLAERLLRPIYAKELAQLAALAEA
jgi:hypothetical protein